MQFLDEAKIYILSGKGGNGVASFRREKFIEFGGPDGGNGGKGGDVIIKADPHLNTLIDFRYQQHFKAQSGEHGKGKNQTGASAQDMVIKVPVGTQIFDEQGDIMIVDINTPTSEFLIAKGGKGGLGNSCFKSSTNQAPRKRTLGGESEEIWVWLKLKLLSDVGLVGFPNAGKSTLLSAVSNATPKIADYAFTTLKPQLGIAKCNKREFVIADIPGLIEGASHDKGLGIRFLKHIERCRILIHMIDINNLDLAASYKQIREEMHNYSSSLSEKPEIIALNKIDLCGDEEMVNLCIEELRKVTKSPIVAISTLAETSLQQLLNEVLSTMDT